MKTFLSFFLSFFFETGFLCCFGVCPGISSCSLKKIYIVILLDNTTRQDCQANSGACGVGGGGSKGRWLGRGERVRIGDGLG